MPGVILLGNQLAAAALQGVDDCQSRCDQTEGCVAWSLGAECLLLDLVFKQMTDPAGTAVSGYRGVTVSHLCIACGWGWSGCVVGRLGWS
jgi:hypothetical protein